MNLAEREKMEAHRRLRLLGNIREDASGAGHRTLASQIGIPVAVLRQWHASYLHRGFEALLPSWLDVSEPTWVLIEQRYAALGVLAEAETLYAASLLTSRCASRGQTHLIMIFTPSLISALPLVLSS